MRRTGKKTHPIFEFTFRPFSTSLSTGTFSYNSVHSCVSVGLLRTGFWCLFGKSLTQQALTAVERTTVHRIQVGYHMVTGKSAWSGAIHCSGTIYARLTIGNVRRNCNLHTLGLRSFGTLHFNTLYVTLSKTSALHRKPRSARPRTLLDTEQPEKKSPRSFGDVAPLPLLCLWKMRSPAARHLGRESGLTAPLQHRKWGGNRARSDKKRRKKSKGKERATELRLLARCCSNNHVGRYSHRSRHNRSKYHLANYAWLYQFVPPKRFFNTLYSLVMK